MLVKPSVHAAEETRVDKRKQKLAKHFYFVHLLLVVSPILEFPANGQVVL